MTGECGAASIPRARGQRFREQGRNPRNDIRSTWVICSAGFILTLLPGEHRGGNRNSSASPYKNRSFLYGNDLPRHLIFLQLFRCI